jgi:hypothetical protein
MPESSWYQSPSRTYDHPLRWRYHAADKAARHSRLRCLSGLVTPIGRPSASLNRVVVWLVASLTLVRSLSSYVSVVVPAGVVTVRGCPAALQVSVVGVTQRIRPRRVRRRLGATRLPKTGGASSRTTEGDYCLCWRIEPSRVSTIPAGRARSPYSIPFDKIAAPKITTRNALELKG